MKPKKVIKGKKSYGKRNILGSKQKVHKTNKSNDKKYGEIVSKGHKNARFAQRGKQMQEEHRRQKRIEDKYRAENTASMFDTYMQKDMLIKEALADPVDEHRNTFDDLLSALNDGNANNRNIATDMFISSDEEQEEDHDENTDDDESDAHDNIAEHENSNNLDALFSTDEDGGEAKPKQVETVDEVKDLDYVDPNQNVSDDDEDDTDDIVENGNHETAPTIDYFAQHVDYELTADHLENLLATPIQCHKYSYNWPALGKIDIELPNTNTGENGKNSNGILPALPISRQEELTAMGINATLAANLLNNEPSLSELQLELLTIFSRYHDLYYPKRTLDDAPQLRTIYCLHALNHLKKTRGRVLQHNAKLAAAVNAAKEAALKAKRQRKNKKLKESDATKKLPCLDANIIPDSYRDQGFVRPKVLIMLPTRNAAFEVVNCLAQLCFGSTALTSTTPNAKNTRITNYERFVEAYTGNSLQFPKVKAKPEDYEQTFAGNTDDNFRLGLTLTKKCIKLFTDFYSSDILIASPLGLRTIIGAPGSAQRDYDFLNSIELLIIDQADMLFAQNWENVLHVIEHLHLQPQSLTRTADFQRVRPWYINGWSRFYRQTMLFATHQLPEFKALLNNKCTNYAGKVNVPRCSNDIRNVLVNLPQVFERFKVPSLSVLDDKRFEHFVTQILPRFSDTSFAHCLIYVPSYFDYVRLRNYMRKEHMSFVQICEYSKDGKIARARDMFYHSGAHFMLYSERAHYFRRTRIKGVRHLIMYAPPAYPHFYSEMINLMQHTNQNARDGLQDNMSITILYSNYDAMQLSNILGNENAIRLLNSSDMVHAFTAE